MYYWLPDELAGTTFRTLNNKCNLTTSSMMLDNLSYMLHYFFIQKRLEYLIYSVYENEYFQILFIYNYVDNKISKETRSFIKVKRQLIFKKVCVCVICSFNILFVVKEVCTCYR